jgi:hypothetical protein
MITQQMEKARELVDWFLDEGLNSFGRYQSSEKEDLEGAKFCATKVVDVIAEIAACSYDNDHIKWWQEVKQEIEKL